MSNPNPTNRLTSEAIQLGQAPEAKAKAWETRHVFEDLKKEKVLNYIIESGQSLRQTAKDLGMSYWVIRRYMRDPVFVDELQRKNREQWDRAMEEMRAERAGMVERLQEASLAALETMEELLKPDAPAAIRHKAAQDLMDRNPEMSRTKKVESGDGEKSPFSPELLMIMASVAREEDEFKGTVIIGNPQLPSEGGTSGD